MKQYLEISDNEIDIIINKSSDELYNESLKYYNIDWNRYFVYLTMAANLNHELAIQKLNCNYSNKLNLQQKHHNVLNFYNKTSNYSHSCNYLGYMYHIGEGIERNYAKAIELYQMAINLGNSNAMYNLADMYENGEGIERNYAKAIELLQMAINLGNSEAMNNLIIMYKKHHMIFDKNKIIEYFIIKKPDALIEIFKYDSFIIEHLQELFIANKEIEQLEKENKQLKLHINASPGGSLYFDMMEDFNSRQS